MRIWEETRTYMDSTLITQSGHDNILSLQQPIFLRTIASHLPSGNHAITNDQVPRKPFERAVWTWKIHVSGSFAARMRASYFVSKLLPRFSVETFFLRIM